MASLGFSYSATSNDLGLESSEDSDQPVHPLRLIINTVKTLVRVGEDLSLLDAKPKSLDLTSNGSIGSNDL